MKISSHITDIWAQSYLPHPASKTDDSDICARKSHRFLFPALLELPVRVLIAEIQRLKKEKALTGKTSREQYDCYRDAFLADEAYLRQLKERYPELTRITEQVVRDTEAYIAQIRRHLQQDHASVLQIFCPGSPFDTLADLDLSIADPHNHGQRAAKVTLDNRTVVYYKPRSLRKNILYQELYNELCTKLGLSAQSVRYLDRGTHGWEEAIPQKECTCKAEVRRYYIRMGIHLLLGYLLSASDLHGENIISCGEYPVIVDFETFPGYPVIPCSQDAGQRTSEYIRGSVQQTGILPVPVWGTGQDTVIVSALHSGRKAKTPFRMPVVQNDGTSNIRIVHKQVTLSLPSCTVRCRGHRVHPADYTEELCAGFEQAYRCFLRSPDLTQKLLPFYEERSRAVIRHTQQYTMYRLASLHPDFCKSETARRQLLHVLYGTGDLTDFRRSIHTYELECLMRMDIPYFEMAPDSASLYDGDGKEHPAYFPTKPSPLQKKKLELLCENDLLRQLSILRMSMALLTTKPRSKRRRSAAVSNRRSLMELHLSHMIDWFLRTAIETEHGVNWIAPQFFSNETWKLAPLGLYLYNGLAGAAVFLAVYAKQYPHPHADALLSKIRRKLFFHTRTLILDTVTYPAEAYRSAAPGTALYQKKQQAQTGIWDGEGSLVTAYLLLYRITEDPEYLAFARKQFQYILSVYQLTKRMDYFDGNAGAILLAVKLYQLTGEEAYRTAAIQIETVLWEHSVQLAQGVGWASSVSVLPLAGLAHGNSGYLIAYAGLWEITRDTVYQEKMLEIIRYEDSLYSEDAKNWKDIRNADTTHQSASEKAKMAQKKSGHTSESPEEAAAERVMNAWCHGAPGILLARMEAAKCRNADQITEDIRRAAEALFEQPPKRQLCLCHGISGNLLIMRHYLQTHDTPAFRRQYESLLDDLLLNLEEYGKQTAYEYFSPGFMNGILGVGMLLLIELSSKQ